MDERVKELRLSIKDKEQEIIKTYSEKWEEQYKRTCGTHFVSFEEFVDEISNYNVQYYRGEMIDISNIRKNCKVYIDEPTIANVINKIETAGLDICFPVDSKDGKVCNMMCAACIGCNCQQIRDCSNINCYDCKKNNYKDFFDHADLK